MTGFENKFWKQVLKTGLNQLHFYLDWIELLEKKILKNLKQFNLQLKKKPISHMFMNSPSATKDFFLAISHL